MSQEGTSSRGRRKAQLQPLQRSVRPAEAAQILGIGESTLWRWVKLRPDMPRPCHLSPRATVFDAGALIAWRDAQGAKR